MSEDSKDGESHYEIVQIPRAREVHQPWIFVPLSTIVSLGECIRIVFASRKEEMRQVGSEKAQSSRVNDRRPFADLLIMNGPGTCVPLVLAAYLLRVSQRSYGSQRGRLRLNFIHLPSVLLRLTDAISSLATTDLRGIFR